MKENVRETDYFKRFIKIGSNPIQSIYSSSATMYGKAFLFSKIRNYMGTEFFLNGYLNTSSNKYLHDFFKDHIKNFDKNYVDNDGNIKAMINISRLDKGTYMYMSTKIYVPNKMISTIMNEESKGDLYIYIFGKKSPKYARLINEILEKNINRSVLRRFLSSMKFLDLILVIQISLLLDLPRDLQILLYIRTTRFLKL